MERVSSIAINAVAWIRHHLLISLGIVVVIGVLVWVSGPVSFAATHTSMRNCGDLYNGFIGPQTNKDNPQARQSIQCFMQAHQQCQAASLSYTTHGVDAGTTETYYTANALGGCKLSVQADSFVDVMPHRTNDFSCAAVSQEADGLHFLSCGDSGDLIVPYYAQKAYIALARLYLA